MRASVDRERWEGADDHARSPTDDGGGGLVLVALTSGCGRDVSSAEAAEEPILGSAPVDVILDGAGAVAVADPRQWARDSSIHLWVPTADGFGTCSGTLVSPRVVLTNEHCVRRALTDSAFVRFGPRNTSFDATGPVTPGTPNFADVPVAACFIHPEIEDGAGSCFDGRVGDGTAHENDVAVLILAERFSGTPNPTLSRYPVIPASVVTEDPAGPTGIHDRLNWTGAGVRLSGYGRRGLFDDSGTDSMRRAGDTTVFGVAPRTLLTSVIQGFAGDSGGPIFLVGDTEDGSPLRLLAVKSSGTPTPLPTLSIRDIGQLLTAPGTQRFLSSVLGPTDRGYPGTMVNVTPRFEVWTGGQDLPRPDELDYARWRDPETGQTAREVDPDGDGFRGRHDLCWGLTDPRQDVQDRGYSATCYSISTGATIEYGCAPRPSRFEGPEDLGVEGSNDNDRDTIPNACDNCPGVPNIMQDDCDGNSVPGVGGGDACAPDDDADGHPNACDNCARFNPSQSDCDEDGVGDACEEDRDGDSRTDDCDNCPGVANYDQADCNYDAIHEVNLRRRVRGLPALPEVGDVCDPDPCGDTHVEERETRRGSERTIHFDEVQVDAIRAHAPAVDAVNGFRFCPCDLATDRTFASRRACVVRAGCTVDDVLAYDRREERAPWAWTSIDGPGLGDGRAGREVELPHTAPATGAFAPDLTAVWNLYPTDARRYDALFPDWSGTTVAPYSGVFWTHTAGVARTDFDFETRLRTSHYLSDAFPVAFTTTSLPAGGDCFDGLVPFAGAFDWHGRIPFLGRNCGLSDLPLGFLVGQAFLPPLPGTDVPEVDLLGQPGNWVAVSEPAGLLPDDGLRYVSLGELGDLLTIVDQRGTGFVQRGASCPNCPPCPQCDPIAPLARARGLEPDGELETIPVLSALRDTVWLIESGSDSTPRLLTRRLGEGAARDPRDLPALGRVLAAVYSPREDVIWLVDERVNGMRPVRRAARLVALQPDTGRVTVVATWTRVTSNDRFALALEPSGGMYLVAGVARSRSHAVVRLDPSLRRSRVSVLGVRVGVGTPVPGMARANDGEVSILVEGPIVRSQRVVEHSARSFRGGGIESCL